MKSHQGDVDLQHNYAKPVVIVENFINLRNAGATSMFNV